MNGARHHVARDEFLALMRQLGPTTTRVWVNGHPLLLGGVMEMVELLPEDTRFGARGPNLLIEPDPFAIETDLDGPTVVSSAESADLVRRLIARQEETDRRQGEESRRGGWWSRLRLRSA